MRKRLMLSRKNKLIAGVCGGIAEYFNIDTTIVRIIWVAFALMTTVIWPMIVAYVICWAILPMDDR